MQAAILELMSQKEELLRRLADKEDNFVERKARRLFLLNYFVKQRLVPDQQHHFLGPPLKAPQPGRQEVLPSAARNAAAGSSRSRSRNPARRNHCGNRASRPSCARASPVHNSGPAPAATRLRTTSSRLAAGLETAPAPRYGTPIQSPKLLKQRQLP